MAVSIRIGGDLSIKISPTFLGITSGNNADRVSRPSAYSLAECSDEGKLNLLLLACSDYSVYQLLRVCIPLVCISAPVEDFGDLCDHPPKVLLQGWVFMLECNSELLCEKTVLTVEQMKELFYECLDFFIGHGLVTDHTILTNEDKPSRKTVRESKADDFTTWLIFPRYIVVPKQFCGGEKEHG